MRNSKMEEKPERLRRVVLVPAPAQGHITPMMQLARALYLEGFSITVAQTKFNYLKPSKDLADFQFVTIQESLPDSDLKNLGPVWFLIKLNKECEVSFKKCLGQLLLQQQDNNEEEIACVIYDEFMYFAEDAAKEFNLPKVIFSTENATAFACRSAMCKLYAKDGLAPLKEGCGREELVPGLHPLRYKDLPTSAFAPAEASVEVFKKSCEEGTASSMIINTVRCLEISSLDWLEKELKIPIYPVGPLHMVASAPPTSLLEENEGCIDWLNKQKACSVIYISLGSFTLMETKEVLEMASGLVSSNQHFLWAIRPGSILGSESNEELFSKMEIPDRGYIVKWAPQKQVLAHSAVGAFWSHCGWNSTLESMGEGVPMICRPFTTDQKVNARYLECVWRVGVQVEGELERGAVERAVTRLMVDKEGEEMKKRALSLKEKLKASVMAEGSSQSSLHDFIRTL